MVEYWPSKPRVAGSNPVSRSFFILMYKSSPGFNLPLFLSILSSGLSFSLIIGVIYIFCRGLSIVPSIKGLPLNRGIKIASERNFKIFIKDEISDTLPRGYIAYQKPAPGSITLKGRRIYIYVSKGDLSKKVPDVSGMRVEQAMKILKDYFLKVDTVYVDSMEPHRVVRTIPSAGSSIKKGDTIIIQVNGEQFVIVPDVKGKNFRIARSILERKGLNVILKAEVNYGFKQGTVFQQSIRPGEKVKKGERIVIKYARLFR